MKVFVELHEKPIVERQAATRYDKTAPLAGQS